MADNNIKTYYDGSFYSLYLEYKDALDDKPHLSWGCFLASKPFWVQSSRKVVSCVCVHHRSMLIRVKALTKLRDQLHMPFGKPKCGACIYHKKCECTCGVCVATGSKVSDFKDIVMCPRKDKERHYNVACVLEECGECGFDRKQRWPFILCYCHCLKLFLEVLPSRDHQACKVGGT